MVQLIAISDIYWLLLFGHVNNFFPIIYAIEPACLGNDFFWGEQIYLTSQVLLGRGIVTIIIC